jgi:hypothetical protein
LHVEAKRLHERERERKREREEERGIDGERGNEKEGYSPHRTSPE